MTSLIIFLLVGGGCLTTAAWAVWQDPASRQAVRGLFQPNGRQ